MKDERPWMVLWRGRHLIVLAVAVSVGLAVLATVMTDRSYEARALMRINQDGGEAARDAFNAQQASQSFANTFATMLQSRAFLERIAPRVAGGRYGARTLQRSVHAEAISDTSLVSLVVRAPTPETARVLAADLSRQFIGALREDTRALLNEQQRAIEARISALDRQIARARSRAPENGERIDSLRLARDALTEQLASALGLNLSRAVDVSLTGPPTASSAPVTPRPLLNIVAGLLLGVLLGVTLAWLRSRLDTRLHSSEEAEAIADTLVVGSIPLRRRPSPDDWAVRNAFDVLLANLTPTDGAMNAELVVVVSPAPGDGRTAVARGLAEAASVAGNRVLLIDGDLRFRTLSRELGARDDPGLTDAILREDVPILAVGDARAPIRFLPAGRSVGNPASLLYSADARTVLSELRADHDLVIIDTPPSRPLPDASILAGFADRALVVGRVGATRRSRLVDLVTALRRRAIATAIVVFEPHPEPVVYGEPAEDEGQRRPASLKL